MTPKTTSATRIRGDRKLDDICPSLIHIYALEELSLAPEASYRRSQLVVRSLAEAERYQDQEPDEHKDHDDHLNAFHRAGVPRSVKRFSSGEGR